MLRYVNRIFTAIPFIKIQTVSSINHTRVLIRKLSSKAEVSLASLLKTEILAEQGQLGKSVPPAGYYVSKRKGTCITMERMFDDGARLQVDFDLAGSVADEHDQELEDIETTSHSDPTTLPEEGNELSSRPELVLKLVKPSGNALIYNCTLPPATLEIEEAEMSEALGEKDENPTFSLDSLSVESKTEDHLTDYFVHTDLLDNDLYERFARVLLDRGINKKFQDELIEFCTNEEQRFYLQFLKEAERVAAE